MKKFALALAAAALIAPSLSFAVGAIAVDDQVGDTEPGYGFVTGADSKDAAKAGALKQCRESGNDNCKFMVWFESCGAYAASKKYYGVGWGSSEAKAREMALSRCGNNNCKVVIAECE